MVNSALFSLIHFSRKIFAQEIDELQNHKRIFHTIDIVYFFLSENHYFLCGYCQVAALIITGISLERCS